MELAPLSRVPPKLNAITSGTHPDRGSGAPFELVHDQVRHEPVRSSSQLFHPMSGLLIILVDTAFFGVDALTLGISTPVTCVMAFGVVTTGVFLCQRFISGDRPGPAVAKAFLGGIMAGLPTPITGTLFGSWVLISSGLSSLWKSPLLRK